MIDYNTMLKIGEILKIAGENILDAKKNKLKISKKKDGTLVTNADLLSQKIIMEELNKLFNGEESIPMVSEELVEDGMVVEKAFNHFFLMDPLDGTNSFINGEDTFCINLAYIKNNIPEVGFIYAPDYKNNKILWMGGEKIGSFKEINGKNIEKITAKKYNQEVGRTALCGPLQKISREEKEKWNIKNEEYLHSAIKFGLVADGTFDIYLRKKNKACDWDIAAGHAILLGSLGEFLIDSDFIYGVRPHIAPSLIAKGGN